VRVDAVAGNNRQAQPLERWRWLTALVRRAFSCSSAERCSLSSLMLKLIEWTTTRARGGNARGHDARVRMGIRAGEEERSP